MIKEKSGNRNVDQAVVADFGDEWHAFNQSLLTDDERRNQFDSYFAIFPWWTISVKSTGFDAGCGSGRWAVLMAQRVGHLHCIEPSSAIDVARHNLRHLTNCSFHRNTIDDMPLEDQSMDFGYSLGVLHHLPDTQQGIVDAVRKLKPGAPFLVYIYYAFDNQPKWYIFLWRISDVARRIISKLPYRLKYLVSQFLAIGVYYPLARIASGLNKVGLSIHSWPLGFYYDKSFYSIRTDALDRFGTRLERRFTKLQIKTMMENAGLERIEFSLEKPFWCAVGFRK
jgi:SAM-dependent methyltransferase